MISKAQSAGGEIALFLLLFGFATVLDSHFLGPLVDLLFGDLAQLLPFILALSLSCCLLLDSAIVLLLLVLYQFLEDATLLKLLGGDYGNLRHC